MDTGLDDKISALIGNFYEGAFDTAIWDGAVRGLMDLTGARFMLVATVDARAHEFSGYRFYSPDDGRFLDGVREYQQELYLSDPTIHFVRRNPHARLFDSRLLGSETELRTHPYVRWQEAMLGSIHSMTVFAPPEDGLTFGVAHHPPATQGPLAKKDEKLFRMAFEHMERATRLAARPPDLEHASEARLVIDRRGRIRAMSEGARAMLASGDGLRVEDGRLHAARPRDTARIDAMIGSALGALTHGGVGGGIAVPRPSGRRDWLVLSSPLPQGHGPFGSYGAAALVRIIDPESDLPSGNSVNWTEMFGLTPAEVRLTQALMATDGDLRAAAERVGIRYSTARVHLRHIFDKTDARGQLPLIRLLQRIER